MNDGVIHRNAVHVSQPEREGIFRSPALIELDFT